MLAFYSDDLSLNPALHFLFFKLFEKKENKQKEAGMAIPVFKLQVHRTGFEDRRSLDRVPPLFLLNCDKAISDAFGPEPTFHRDIFHRYVIEIYLSSLSIDLYEGFTFLFTLYRIKDQRLKPIFS